MKKILLLSLLLPGCVGGTLGNTSEFEEYPIREATAGEGRRLKTCLRAAHHVQTKHKEAKGRYYGRASDLPVEAYCEGFVLSQAPIEGGYEISAQFHDNEQTVRWSVNHDGVIEEHLGSSLDDDIDFF